ADSLGGTSSVTVTVTVNNTATISGTMPKLKWFLMSVPVQPTDTSPTAMFGSGSYKIYRWDPTAPDDPYLDKYKAPSSLDAGYAFWIKAYYNDLTYSYNGTLIDTTQNYTIALKAGWNQIGAPFNREFPWGQVQVKDGANTYDLTTAANMGLISTTAYSYDSDANSWVQNDTSANIQAGVGYDVRAYSDVELLFGPGAGMPGGLAKRVRTVYDYKLRISARTKNSADLDNYLGAANNANAEYDALDAEEPPKSLNEKYISVYFQNDNWTRNAGRYANDFRAPARNTGNTEAWTLNVVTNEIGETVTLTWDSASLPFDRFSFTLINLDTGGRINMAQQNIYTYTAAGAAAVNHFKIEVVKLQVMQVTKTYTMKPGWNLIGVPIEPEVTSALTQLGDDLPLLNVYQYFDRQFYAADAADIQAGLGYWVYVAENTEIDLVGMTVSDEVRVPLKEGWNLIGNPYEGPLVWGDNLEVEVDDIALVLSEAAKQGLIGSEMYEFDGVGYKRVNTGDALQPWRGYIIKAKKDCVLILKK
ncbi:MAG: hypothetical protein AB1546_05030, partial [bacterium]